MISCTLSVHSFIHILLYWNREDKERQEEEKTEKEETGDTEGGIAKGKKEMGETRKRLGRENKSIREEGK